MKISKQYIIPGILLLLAVIPCSLYAAQGYLGKSKMYIEGDYWEMLHDENLLTITGNVFTKSENMELWCEKMVVFFEKDDTASNDSGSNSKQISKIIATKNVKIDLKNGYTTFSDKAEYIKKRQEVTLSENPIIKNEVNEVRGCLITYFLNSKSYTVESCTGKQSGMTVK
ncbi:LptA/OstA family protein [Desulfogranum japonicum]|uniref:LptA/OstA family protein n=1 Tax=Desulfogranum japonicum TaxID=231447 RepID=UPI00048F5A89|nr:LptA/OstA family protein [Desulfogranum japonicum]